MCPGVGKSRCREVVITDKVHTGQKKTKHDRLVAIVLKIAIFLSQRANQRVGEVRSRQLKLALGAQGAVDTERTTNGFVG